MISSRIPAASWCPLHAVSVIASGFQAYITAHHGERLSRRNCRSSSTTISTSHAENPSRYTTPPHGGTAPRPVTASNPHDIDANRNWLVGW